MKEAYKANPIMRYFEYEYLLPHLAEVSEPFCNLAKKVDESLPEGPEKEVCLRKLLEAKDAAIRTLV